MTIDDMKNKISMKLGGTDAQLGFEVICKKLAELEKENTELKAQISKYEETIDIEQDLNKDASGEIELYQQENAGLKQILYKLVNAFNDYECAGPEQEQENAWEILRDLMHEELFKLTTRNK